MDKVELMFKEYLPFLWIYPFSSIGFAENYKRYIGTDVSLLYKVAEGELTDYQSADAPQRIYAAAKDIFQKEDFWKDLYKEYRETITSLESLSALIKTNENLNSLSSEEIIGYLENIQTATEILYPMTNMCYFFTLEFENHIAEPVTGLLPMHPTYSLSFRESAFTLKTTFFPGLDLNQKIIEDTYISNPEFKDAMHVLTDKFQYLTSINGEIRSPRSFFADIVAAIEVEHQNADKLSNNQKIMAECLFYKDEISTYVIPFVKHGFIRLWQEIARRLGTTVERIECLNIPELSTFITTLNPAEIESLMDQRHAFTWSYHVAFSNETHIFQGKEQEPLFNEILKQYESRDNTLNLDTVTEFGGKTGSKGKAQGPVFIVSSADQQDAFPEGGILVAVYTAPELVPIMKKAKAIVTDTGGIACHAAIVARELGIPCIVGTKIATKVLKNGDMVEVDADSGIIRKV